MNQGATNPEDKTVITIPKENAVFWMDGQGRWHNRHGPFEHQKLIAYFNASIRKDEDGYYVAQISGDIIEKVYFQHQGTALFAVDFKWRPVVELMLNTGALLCLDPERLYLSDDQLYMAHDGEVVKFAQYALLKLSERMDFERGACWLAIEKKRYKISRR